VNAAMLSFTKAMAEVGVRDGVQVNAINPGTIRTGRFQKRLAGESDLAAAERKFVANARIRRIGEPEDIANLVAFVVSAEGSLLQGAVIDMDSGETKTL
jgi:3-oxoacyl-[acyl-carrier protein] reductase